MDSDWKRTLLKLLGGAVFGAVATFLALLAFEYIDVRGPDLVYGVSPSVTLQCEKEFFEFQQIMVANLGNELESDVYVNLKISSSDLLRYGFTGFGSPTVAEAESGEASASFCYKTLIPGATAYLVLQLRHGATISPADVEVYGNSGFAREKTIE